MRRSLIIALLCALSLTYSISGFSEARLNVSADRTKAITETSLSTAFSSFDTEIELIAFNSIVPGHITVEKKETFYTFLSSGYSVSNSLFQQPVSCKVLAIIAATNYKLLFPFHHFW